MPGDRPSTAAAAPDAALDHKGGPALPADIPRDGLGRPLREPGDDCCIHYRFRPEAGGNYFRCGWCQNYSGDRSGGGCTNEKNGRIP